MKKPKIVIGIDPATGSASPAGIAVFEANTNTILFTFGFGTKYKVLQYRIKDIVDKIKAILDLYTDSNELEVQIYIEQFVMQGVGGQTLQRFIGAVMSIIPFNIDLLHVDNVTVKKGISGNGHANKAEVADGVLNYFKTNAVSLDKVTTLILKKKWDELDALAIGVVGFKGYGKR